MKDLLFILKRTSQAELARKLEIDRSNISIWKKLKKVPRYQAVKLKEIKKCYK